MIIFCEGKDWFLVCQPHVMSGSKAESDLHIIDLRITYQLSRLTNPRLQIKLKVQLFDYTKRWSHYECTI